MKKWHYISINIYWFGIAFMWNGLHPIILPALLLNYVPENLKNTYLGGMTFVGLILAMLIQPLAGALSDRTRTRWGMRRPWMVAGTLFSMLFLGLMAYAGGLWGIVVAYLLLQFASNVAHGPAQGLIPDLIPTERRGLASGIKNLFDMGGLVVTSLVAGQLMGRDNPVRAFVIIILVLGFSAFFTIFTTPEEPLTKDTNTDEEFRWQDLLTLNRHRYPDYFRLLLSRFLILLGIYAVQGFAQYFIRDYLRVPNAAEVTGNLMATIGLALILLVFPAGILSDKLGRKRLNMIAGGMASLGIFLLIFVHDITMLYAVGAIIGMATGIFLSVNWALATDLIPQTEGGKYLGLSNFATAGASASSRLAGPLIDGINALAPGAFLGYPVLFLLAAGISLVGALLMRRVNEHPLGTLKNQPN
ncbi:MAG TPA: SLC45 family MFS transporter [Anaerolineae bacterium]|nr:SLC45 family MFS transporter [Anaerolineae bacterium]